MARSKNWFLLLFIVFACSSPPIKEDQQVGIALGKITYESSILNTNPDDAWANECLAGFDRKSFLNQIFNAVHTGKLSALDYFSGEKISPSRLKELEASGEFSKEKIAKVQFEEEWFWDEEKRTLQKKINSMTFAYEVFNNLGESRGFKPAFKIISK